MKTLKESILNTNSAGISASIENWLETYCGVTLPSQSVKVQGNVVTYDILYIRGEKGTGDLVPPPTGTTFVPSSKTRSVIVFDPYGNPPVYENIDWSQYFKKGIAIHIRNIVITQDLLDIVAKTEPNTLILFAGSTVITDKLTYDWDFSKFKNTQIKLNETFIRGLVEHQFGFTYSTF